MATTERPDSGHQGTATPPPQSAWPAGALQLSIWIILAGLLSLSALAWVLTARQSDGGHMAPGIAGLLERHDSGMSPMGAQPMDMPGTDMEVHGMGAPVFIGMWVSMMVAMMFPSVAPIVVAHWRLSSGREQGPLALPLFVGGYLLSWTLIGVAAFGAYRGVLALAPSLASRTAALVAGGTLALAGLYQFTKFKTICLTHCRSPFEFFLHWKPGYLGAVRMGVEHGFYCVGCCWGLMLVLFVVGLMNLAWMGILAAVIFVEKVAPFGWRMTRGVGVALVTAGITLAVFPGLLESGLVGG